MAQVQQLFRLQETDTEIQEKKKRLSEVLQILKGPAWYTTAQTHAETTGQDLESIQGQHSSHNLELQSTRQKIKNSENRLYSGKVTNPKELSDLQSEIDSLNRRASGQEDEVLELMILLEDAEIENEAATADLAAAEERWATESAALQTEKNELAQRLNALIAERQKQAAVIEAPLLKEYEQLLKKKGGTAVVRLRGDMCLGCRMGQSAIVIKRAKEGQKVNCGSCDRIIYPY